ncbi:hypothetical protein PUNSTDRAFT_113754 [Punctularia strigosozonata HHB-11173 SS5]|uniref:uncharacterized protein n=1 Tax=Punctularia strigosozonata (strain HHB-11173) TaxID=741275 RepID=UPI0004417841|nr:uncharacterized protein PUNSTDRAFT_113754 [Punctularia strigosozonata HHB-11173 SS5]EIN08150.1 hypothetical protein PUNSTDRAFT_113754 [Punctularia strigosozonata HHB-11173 SS5]
MIRGSGLKGMLIPGMAERTIVSLFADDTSVVLSHEDKFEDLTQILDTWCVASGAKFNVAKTAIIPLGPKEYRDQLIETRKLDDSHESIPAGISISKDGTAIRFLGAWIGNEIDDATPWGPVIEKIDAALTRWERGHPTLEGRRLITQMVVGGMTQYLTKVQGMPKDVETHLSKKIQSFVWNGQRTPPSVSRPKPPAPEVDVYG